MLPVELMKDDSSRAAFVRLVNAFDPPAFDEGVGVLDGKVNGDSAGGNTDVL